MVTYYVDKDEIYKVSATVNCAVYDASGSTIATCDAGLNVVFKAPTSKIMVSDDNAALTRLSESSGGSGGSGDFAEHMANSTIHVTADEKARWDAVAETGGVSDDDREYWNSKLNPPSVYESIVLNPLGTQEDNANAYGFVYVIPRSGYVTAIDIYCRTEGQAAPYPTTITRVKVWRGTDELLATSNNYPAHVTGAVLKYTFKTPFYVKKGEELRVSFHTGDNWGANEYTMGIKECCMATVALTSGESGGLLGSDGSISNSSYTAKHHWYIDAEKFTPFEHSEDTSIHVTAVEKNKLNLVSSHVEDDSIHVTQYEKDTLNSINGQMLYTIDTMPTNSGECDAMRLPATVVPHEQSLAAIAIPDVRNSCSTPLYLAAFAKVGSTSSQLLGVSTNAVTWEVGEDAIWEFAPAISIPDECRLELFLCTDPATVTSTDAPAPGVRIQVRDLNSGEGAVRYQGVWYDGRTPYVRFETVAHADNSSIHVSEADRTRWNNAAPKNYGVANAILITDADGNIVASTVISVAELNTLNNNTANLKTKLADLESRLAALETA